MSGHEEHHGEDGSGGGRGDRGDGGDDFDRGEDWRPMVALQHVRPGRPDHVDWLLARDPAGERPLRSFRCGASPTALAAERPAGDERARVLGMRAIADHRTRYLDYEGPVSRGRGEVRRIARGRWRAAGPADDAAGEQLELAWEGGRAHIVTIVTRADAATSPADTTSLAPPPPAEHPDESVAWLLA